MIYEINAKNFSEDKDGPKFTIILRFGPLGDRQYSSLSVHKEMFDELSVGMKGELKFVVTEEVA